jgi:hypothetical protein
MTNGIRKRPSFGFLIVCATYILVVVFFAFGFTTPDLDRVWTLHHFLKIGHIEQLDVEDRVLLDNAIKRHTKLTNALLGGEEIGIISAHMDGWISTPVATLLRTAKAEKFRAITVDVQTPEDLLPFEIKVKAKGWKKEVKLKNHGRIEIELPAVDGTPEIIEVFLTGQEFSADQSLLGVRLSFEESR